MRASDEEIDIEAGRRLFAQECRFVAGCDRDAALPPVGLPEIAFAGRSNVGKSSLVNALTGRLRRQFDLGNDDAPTEDADTEDEDEATVAASASP